MIDDCFHICALLTGIILAVLSSSLILSFSSKNNVKKDAIPIFAGTFAIAIISVILSGSIKLLSMPALLIALLLFMTILLKIKRKLAIEKRDKWNTDITISLTLPVAIIFAVLLRFICLWLLINGTL